MKNKKGQIGGLVPLVTTLIIVGLLLGAGFMIIEKFRDDDSLKDTLATVSNETGGYINETGYTLTGASATAFNSVVITVVYNDTSGDSGVGGYNWTVPSGNYTVSSSGVVTNATTENYYNVTISYTYLYGEGAWIGTNSTIEALTTVPDLLGLIILVAMIGIVLAIIFNVMPMGRVSGA